MKIETTRFGSIDVESDDVIDFSDGIWGLQECRHWVLLADSENDTLAWLQSVQRPGVALAVVSPRRFVPEYQVRVYRSELEPLALSRAEDAQVLTIVSRNDDGITLNLKAPLVINLERRVGRQVVINTDAPVQHSVGVTSTTWRKTA